MYYRTGVAVDETQSIDIGDKECSAVWRDWKNRAEWVEPEECLNVVEDETDCCPSSNKEEMFAYPPSSKLWVVVYIHSLGWEMVRMAVVLQFDFRRWFAGILYYQQRDTKRNSDEEESLRCWPWRECHSNSHISDSSRWWCERVCAGSGRWYLPWMEWNNPWSSGWSCSTLRSGSHLQWRTMREEKCSDLSEWLEDSSLSHGKCRRGTRTAIQIVCLW